MTFLNVYQKVVDNTYEARFKRLKEELDRPTELNQMYNAQNENLSPLLINSTAKYLHSKTKSLESKTLKTDRY